MDTHPFNAFSEEDIRSTQPAMKIGLLATVTPEGLPHVTLLSSLMACGPAQLCFGQFTEGFSKKHILANPKTGFLVMSLDKNLWRGKATYTHYAKQGPEYDYYNNVPMFRYNAYFGVHTVYYLDLVAHSGKSPLPMNRIIFAAIQTLLARTLGRKPGKQSVLNVWTRAFLDKIDNLKFLSYVGADGYPVLIPAIQAQSLDPQHVLFSPLVYRDELQAIPAGVHLAVFGMALTMEDVLMRGTYQGIRRVGGIKAGVVEVEWVYNPMPPVPGQVYPPVELQAVTEF
ncbi:MAG TPA: pyridoxamine 5'-phosphate oxidase family protein [Anaerolineales bacterium]